MKNRITDVKAILVSSLFIMAAGCATNPLTEINDAAYNTAKARLDEQIVHSKYPGEFSFLTTVDHIGKIGKEAVGGGHTGRGQAMRIPAMRVLEGFAAAGNTNAEVRRRVSHHLAELCAFPSYTKKERKALRDCFDSLKAMMNDTDSKVQEEAMTGIHFVAVTINGTYEHAGWKADEELSAYIQEAHGVFKAKLESEPQNWLAQRHLEDVEYSMRNLKKLTGNPRP